MFKVLVGYPSEEEEFEIIKMTTTPHEEVTERTLNAREISALQELVRRVPCADHVARYAMRLTRATRVEQGEVPRVVKEYVTWGAGPRASQHLVLAGKARAILKGRFHVSSEDIRAVAHPVLRHRILTNFNAEADGVSSDVVVDQLIRDVPLEGASSLDSAMSARVFTATKSDGDVD